MKNTQVFEGNQKIPVKQKNLKMGRGEGTPIALPSTPRKPGPGRQRRIRFGQKWGQLLPLSRKDNSKPGWVLVFFKPNIWRQRGLCQLGPERGNLGRFTLDSKNKVAFPGISKVYRGKQGRIIELGVSRKAMTCTCLAIFFGDACEGSWGKSWWG